MAGTKKNVKKSAWQTCGRGHKYRGNRCPDCWKRDHPKVNKTSDKFFIKGLRDFNAGFLY